MPVFELRATSMSDGNFAAAWFDDEACLWNDDRLGATVRLASIWAPPSLRLHRPERGPTPVLFNPNAIAVSKGIHDELAEFEEVEFLPIAIAGHGEFYILHVVQAIELPADTIARIAPAPSGNIIEVHGFADAFTPPDGFFRILHPVGSAARRQGNRATRAVYAGPGGQRALARFAGPFLEARRV